MATGDMRQYETFYGICLWDWSTSWGGISNTSYHLIKNYLSDAVKSVPSTQWIYNGGDYVQFLYPHRVKKKYWIEGVIEGQITFMSDPTLVSFVSSFDVILQKIHTDTTESDLASTGSTSIKRRYAVGDEEVYHYWIDVNTPQEVGENEYLAIKVRWNFGGEKYTAESSTTAWLYHDNDSTYEDLKMTIPLALD